jgi:hypothetical protein
MSDMILTIWKEIVFNSIIFILPKCNILLINVIKVSCER